jgi:hypothetical protein
VGFVADSPECPPQTPQETAMEARWKTALATAVTILSAPAMADLTFYEHPNFTGRSFTTTQRVSNFGRSGFNNHVSEPRQMPTEPTDSLS